jgi:hypothetical protein
MLSFFFHESANTYFLPFAQYTRDFIMLRTFLGVVLGVVLAALLMGGTRLFLHLGTEERFALEHSTVYLVVILAAGFGAITGAILHLATSRTSPP